MKTVASLDQLRRVALAAGAEMVFEGRTFNAGRETVVASPNQRQPAPPAAVAPTPPEPAKPAATLTLDEVEQLLGRRDALWMARMERLVTTLQTSLAALPQATSDKIERWTFKATYGNRGAIDVVVGLPTYTKD